MLQYLSFYFRTNKIWKPKLALIGEKSSLFGARLERKAGIWITDKAQAIRLKYNDIQCHFLFN